VPAVSQALPTIPSSPPPLPSTFPQAFDSIITQNFTSPSCLNFFNNMTSSNDFRQCRPFSFLYSTSSTFINVSFSPWPIFFTVFLTENPCRPSPTWPSWIHLFGVHAIRYCLIINVNLIWHRLRRHSRRNVLKSCTIKI
jgi:hypothetical protein